MKINETVEQDGGMASKPLLVAGVGAAVDSEMLYHDCPYCNNRCNCSTQPCCCCEDDFYDDIRDESLQPMIPIEYKEQP